MRPLLTTATNAFASCGASAISLALQVVSASGSCFGAHLARMIFALPLPTTTRTQSEIASVRHSPLVIIALPFCEQLHAHPKLEPLVANDEARNSGAGEDRHHGVLPVPSVRVIDHVITSRRLLGGQVAFRRRTVLIASTINCR